MISEPMGALTCRSTTLIVLAYSSLFCGQLITIFGSRAIFIVAEPLGALTYRSSTLTVLADSDPFHGLLLIVFAGERSNFKIFLRTRKIMVMHSNERGECCLRTHADRLRKR